MPWWGFPLQASIDVSVSNLYDTTATAAPASPSTAVTLPARGLRRRLLLLPAWVLPVGLIIAFGGLFTLVYRDRLMPALPVNTAPAILLADIEEQPKDKTSVATGTAGAAATSADQKAGAPTPASASTGRMLFQAGGWFEPDPLPIFAIALTDGVISKVHVLEGQEVRKGEPLAELISDDARIALGAAERGKERAVAELQLQHVQVAVAEADATAMADQVKVTEARLAEETDNLARLTRIPAGSVSEQEKTRAKFIVQGQTAEVAGRKSQHAATLAKVAAARAQSAVLEAAVSEASVEVEKQKLALSRTRIDSPVDGVILELHAAPGQKKLLAMDDHQSATIATLFEKGKLQARVDVPLADARDLSTGQQAVITSDFLPNAEFRGVVSRIVGSANLQRNTLQAKVRVIDPDPRLRPEMLCRVKFMEAAPAATAGAPASPAASSHDSTRAIMVPEASVITEGGSTASLWAIAPDGTTASRRSVTVGSVKREGYVAIDSGLLAGELVILPPFDGLSHGRRVRSNQVSH